MQGHTQLIIGLAFIIASLASMTIDKETPLYHIFIARSLADVTLTGHAAAVHVFPTEHNWTFRLLLIFLTVLGWKYGAGNR